MTQTAKHVRRYRKSRPNMMSMQQRSLVTKLIPLAKKQQSDQRVARAGAIGPIRVAGWPPIGPRAHWYLKLNFDFRA